MFKNYVTRTIHMKNFHDYYNISTNAKGHDNVMEWVARIGELQPYKNIKHIKIIN